MRRGALANLKVEIFTGDFLAIKEGKNKKDRTYPIICANDSEIKELCLKGEKSGDLVFGLTGPSITRR